MVWRAGAVGAHIAVNAITAVALVCIYLEIALGEVEVGLRDDLVQGEFAATLQLASTAVA
jgi:hypothetical protein